jgi:hypothetical protein
MKNNPEKKIAGKRNFHFLAKVIFFSKDLAKGNAIVIRLIIK